MRRRPSCQKRIMIAYFVFQNGCLATRRWEQKKQRRTRATQQRELSARCAPQKKTLDAHLLIWSSEIVYGTPINNAIEPTGTRRARASPPPQYRDDPLLRF